MFFLSPSPEQPVDPWLSWQVSQEGGWCVNQFPWFTIDTTRSRTYQHQCVGPPISDVAGQTPLIQEVVSLPDQNQ
jgi:hypothetical protein